MQEVDRVVCGPGRMHTLETPPAPPPHMLGVLSCLGIYSSRGRWEVPGV